MPELSRHPRRAEIMFLVDSERQPDWTEVYEEITEQLEAQCASYDGWLSAWDVISFRLSQPVAKDDDIEKRRLSVMVEYSVGTSA